MGCGSSANKAPDTSSQRANGVSPQSRDVDAILKKERDVEEHKIKMLLLGAGECGKSTIFKQMRLLYGSERTDDDLRMYGVVARSNIVVAMRKLCSLLRNLGLEWELDKESHEIRETYDEVMTYLVDKSAVASSQDPGEGSEADWVGRSPLAGEGANADANMFLAIYELLHTLWQSNTMRKVWLKRSKVDVIDAHIDYLNDIHRIASPDFKPTKKDVLIARVRTTQVVCEKYFIKGTQFEMYDVGGQRSNRRKWIDCFDSVTAVIFVAALSEYDQTLAEAKRSNRMVESLELFRSVCNNRAFTESSVILFLNKKDIFAEKILYSDIVDQPPFAEYDGPVKDYEAGVRFFIQMFKNSLMDDELNDSFIHVTCATDTNNMQFVLDSTSTIIKSQNLKKSGFLGID